MASSVRAESTPGLEQLKKAVTFIWRRWADEIYDQVPWAISILQRLTEAIGDFEFVDPDEFDKLYSSQILLANTVLRSLRK